MKKITFDKTSPAVDFTELERQRLKHWYGTGIVTEYLHKNDSSAKKFFFLDGPITANNPMGVHHAWGRTYKDLWQRFYAMRGYRQRFQNGFDCQGLWVEVEVEKELELHNKKDIENLIPGDSVGSVAKFVDLCRARVIKYSTIQTQQSKRLGYFMDWDNSYYTMSDENNYMIWHFLKSCHDKGWIYKGDDSVPWCPRCQTAISQHEMLTEDYKELTHESVYVKLPVTGGQKRILNDSKVKSLYLLIWTTTPWTVPANVAVGINVKYTYGIWLDRDSGDAVTLIDKDENGLVPIRQLKGKEVSVSDYVFDGIDGHYEKIAVVSGKELLDIKYRGPFDQLPAAVSAGTDNERTFHTVVDGSMIVTSTEGTGLLHVAPGAGKEDFDLGRTEHLPVISVIDDEANYLDTMGEFSGKNAKKHPELIFDYLKQQENGRYLFKTQKYTHRYPACWRCKAELVWKIASEWYIAMDVPEKSKDKNRKSGKNSTLREQMKKTARMIKWHPEFGLERELDWLSNMRDWLISKKNRYWGLALPVWECSACGWFDIVGSAEELRKRAVSGWEEFEGHTPHKPFIDKVKIGCGGCGKPVSRVNDVANVWLDAGIVPFSTLVDPGSGKLSYTTDKKYWKNWFPADFITESFPGQFKNWFYSMIAMSTVLEKKAPFETVLGYASMLGEDGRPMHKSWGNSIEFNEGAEKIGADVMRWMFATHDPEQNLLFGYKKADETRRKFHLMLWNIYNFFVSNAIADDWHPEKEDTIPESDHILDIWIISRLNSLIATVTLSLEKYAVSEASGALEGFVIDLSQWYIRRSRDRVGPSADNGMDKNDCYLTLYSVLVTLMRILAPFVPFLADEIYTNLTKQRSVHLSIWPDVNPDAVKSEVEALMHEIRLIVEEVHSVRKKNGIKVRQPLAELWLRTSPEHAGKFSAFESLLCDELNVKKISYSDSTEFFLDGKKAASSGKNFYLDILITAKLEQEGAARDLIRQIQLLRKDAGCTMDQHIGLDLPHELSGYPAELLDNIRKHTLADSIIWADSLKIRTG